MMRLLSILVVSIFAFELAAQDNHDRMFFAGGKSDISSSDKKRAQKAIEKWTSPEGEQGGVKLSEAPFYWDHSKVGRPVFIRILKNANWKGRLEVWLEDPQSKRFERYKTYRISFYSGKLGPKKKSGDRQAPEGFYWVNAGRLNPNSSYHLSIDMGYPNAFDRSKKRSGSYLMIHGSTLSIGCFAMTDCSIEQIYTLVNGALKKGQKLVRVHSFPFEMTDGNLAKYRNHEHFEFWQNLKEGWDWFEAKKRPPNVSVSGGEYQFSDG